jgi:hypothetical protein
MNFLYTNGMKPGISRAAKGYRDRLLFCEMELWRAAGKSGMLRIAVYSGRENPDVHSIKPP